MLTDLRHLLITVLQIQVGNAVEVIVSIIALFKCELTVVQSVGSSSSRPFLFNIHVVFAEFGRIDPLESPFSPRNVFLRRRDEIRRTRVHANGCSVEQLAFDFECCCCFTTWFAFTLHALLVGGDELMTNFSYSCVPRCDFQRKHC
jgi:hypothetical protein